MQKYKVTGPRPVEGAAPGGELEHEFDAGTEAGHIAAGRLEILPRPYRVCGPRKLSGPGYEASPNETFEAALTIEQEASLVEAGHIERLKEKKESASKAVPTSKEKEA